MSEMVAQVGKEEYKHYCQSREFLILRAGSVNYVHQVFNSLVRNKIEASRLGLHLTLPFITTQYTTANLKFEGANSSVQYVDRLLYSVEKKLFTLLSIQDPELFYIKLMDKTGESDEALLKNALKNFSQLTDVPEPKELLEGLAVVVPDPGNHGRFCRGEVGTLVKGRKLIIVDLIDKGVSVELPPSTIKNPTTALLRIPKLAIACRLNKLEPADIAWDTLNWEEIFQPEDSLIRFLSKSLNVHNVNIESNDEDLGLKLSTKLSLAKVVAPQLITDIEGSFPRSDFSCWTDVKVPVYGVSADSMGEACLQLQPELVNIAQDSVAEYIEQLSECEKKTPFSKDVGSPCIAQYDEDGLWYRAEILELVAPGIYSVSFVDYGNVESVHESKMVEIPPELLKFPVGATICEVAGMESVQKGSAGLKKFKELIEDLNLHGEIKNANFLDSVGKRKLLISLWDEEGKSIESFFHCTNEPKAMKICVNKPHIASPIYSYIMIETASVDFNKEYEGVISYVDSEESIWLQLDENADEAAALTNELQKFYSTYEYNFSDEVIEVGMHCVSKQPADSFWYRAQVKSMSPDKKAITVLYVDYGNSDVVSLDDLKPLIAYFAKEKALAVKTSLEVTIKNKEDLDVVIDGILDFAVDKLVIKLKKINNIIYASIRNDTSDLTGKLVETGLVTKLSFGKNSAPFVVSYSIEKVKVLEARVAKGDEVDATNTAEPNILGIKSAGSKSVTNIEAAAAVKENLCSVASLHSACGNMICSQRASELMEKKELINVLKHNIESANLLIKSLIDESKVIGDAIKGLTDLYTEKKCTAQTLIERLKIDENWKKIECSVRVLNESTQAENSDNADKLRDIIAMKDAVIKDITAQLATLKK